MQVSREIQTWSENIVPIVVSVITCHQKILTLAHNSQLLWPIVSVIAVSFSEPNASMLAIHFLVWVLGQ